MSAGEREEALLESSLRRLPGVSRTNVVATLSPKGGCGKTTSTFLAGNVLAGHLRLRALAVDLNPDFGTLADLAPDRARAPLSLVDLLRDKERIGSPGELRPYVSRLPSGLHLLAAPPDPAVMAQMTPELYGELLAFLRRFYEVILLDLGTGVTAPIATFAVEHADQVVVVTTPEWITNTKVQMALSHLRLEHAHAGAQQGRGRRRRSRPPSASSAASGCPSAWRCPPTSSSRRCSTPGRSRWPGSRAPPACRSSGSASPSPPSWRRRGWRSRDEAPASDDDRVAGTVARGRRVCDASALPHTGRRRGRASARDGPVGAGAARRSPASIRSWRGRSTTTTRPSP